MGDIRIMNKMENKRIRHGIILSALILCVCAVMFSVSLFQKSVFAETVPEMVKINKSVSIKVLDSAQLEEGVDSTAIRFTGNVLNNCFENGVLKQNYSVGMLLVMLVVPQSIIMSFRVKRNKPAVKSLTVGL